MHLYRHGVNLHGRLHCLVGYMQWRRQQPVINESTRAVSVRGHEKSSGCKKTRVTKETISQVGLLGLQRFCARDLYYLLCSWVIGELQIKLGLEIFWQESAAQKVTTGKSESSQLWC